MTETASKSTDTNFIVQLATDSDTYIRYDYLAESNPFSLVNLDGATMFTATSWDKVRGNMPKYSENNPMFIKD